MMTDPKQAILNKSVEMWNKMPHEKCCSWETDLRHNISGIIPTSSTERLTPHLEDSEESAVQQVFPASHIQLAATHRCEINLKQVSLQAR